MADVQLADLREEAEKYFANGFLALAAAFDLAGGRPWSFDKEVQRKAQGLLFELHCLFHENAIQHTAIGAAKIDQAFQSFLKTATAKPKRRRRASG